MHWVASCIPLNLFWCFLSNVQQEYHLAVEDLDFERAIELLADVNPGIGGTRALVGACKSGALDFVDELLKSDNLDPWTDWNEALYSACKNGHVEIAKRIIKDPRIGPEYRFDRPICLTCEKGNLDQNLVGLLLEQKPYENSPQSLDYLKESQSIIEMLLGESRIFVCQKCRRDFLYDAARNGCSRRVQLILENGGFEPNECILDFALTFAAEEGHLEVVKLILEQPTPFSNEAMSAAASNGHSKIIQLLLEDGRTDPGGSDNYAIRAAASNQHYNVVRLLLADPRVDPKAGKHAVAMEAIYDDAVFLMAQLIQHPKISRRYRKFYLLAACKRVDPPLGIISLLMSQPDAEGLEAPFKVVSGKMLRFLNGLSPEIIVFCRSETTIDDIDGLNWAALEGEPMEFLIDVAQSSQNHALVHELKALLPYKVRIPRAFSEDAALDYLLKAAQTFETIKQIRRFLKTFFMLSRQVGGKFSILPAELLIVIVLDLI